MESKRRNEIAEICELLKGHGIDHSVDFALVRDGVVRVKDTMRMLFTKADADSLIRESLIYWQEERRIERGELSLAEAKERARLYFRSHREQCAVFVREFCPQTDITGGYSVLSDLIGNEPDLKYHKSRIVWAIVAADM